MMTVGDVERRDSAERRREASRSLSLTIHKVCRTPSDASKSISGAPAVTRAAIASTSAAAR